MNLYLELINFDMGQPEYTDLKFGVPQASVLGLCFSRSIPLYWAAWSLNTLSLTTSIPIVKCLAGGKTVGVSRDTAFEGVVVCHGLVEDR